MLWNENVDSPTTSAHVVVDLHRPERRTPMKVLKDKSFHFVDGIWRIYVAKNQTNVE